MKMTGSKGNRSGRNWVLKKWMVKMKAAASSASSLWMVMDTLITHPGSTSVTTSGNHRTKPVSPITITPQRTAK